MIRETERKQIMRLGGEMNTFRSLLRGKDGTLTVDRTGREIGVHGDAARDESRCSRLG